MKHLVKPAPPRADMQLLVVPDNAELTLQETLVNGVTQVSVTFMGIRMGEYEKTAEGSLAWTL